MNCANGQHAFADGTLRCSGCGAKASALARGEALPYAEWSLTSSSPVAETSRSLTFAARDSRDGTLWLIREFFPDAGRADDVRKRRFVAGAKALRGSTFQAMRTHFPYTRGGLCYVVSRPLEGVSLQTLMQPGKTSEAEAIRCLGSLLRALAALHGCMGSAGPLFAGGFKLSDVIFAGRSLSDPFEVSHSLYLENMLAESPLTPEQGSGLDVQSAGEVILELVAGKVPPARQAEAVTSQIRSAVLGAALEYILHPAHGQRPSAKQALLHLDLLSKAQQSGDARDWKAAFELSGAGRVRELAIARPVQAAPAPRPEPPPAAPNIAPPLVAAPPMPPPVPPPMPPVARPGNPGGVAAKAAVRRRGGGSVMQGCLLTVLFCCGLLILLVVRACAPEPQAPEPDIVFGVGPNPAARDQQVTLTWAVTGYSSVRINNAVKPLRGSETFQARRTTTYVLIASGKDHHEARREVKLVVQNARTSEMPLLPGVPDEGSGLKPAVEPSLLEANRAEGSSPPGLKLAQDTAVERIPADSAAGTAESHPPVAAEPPASAGTLRYAGPPVHFGETIAFSGLPGAMLRISFDRENWMPQFFRQADGSQTLSMRSLSHDEQTQCVVDWQVSQ